VLFGFGGLFRGSGLGAAGAAAATCLLSTVGRGCSTRGAGDLFGRVDAVFREDLSLVVTGSDRSVVSTVCGPAGVSL
jgi:hypothetical protein